MSSSSKKARAYGGLVFTVLGAMLIGMGILANVILPVATLVVKELTDERERILDTWERLHPSENFPMGVIGVSGTQFSDVQRNLTFLMSLGVAILAVGVFMVNSAMKAVSPLSPTSQ